MSSKSDPITVVHYQRRPLSMVSYSVEFQFDDIRNRLHTRLPIVLRVAPYISKGFFRRIAIILDALTTQCDVLHIVGDITFAALLVFRPKLIVTLLDCGFLHSKRGLKLDLLKLLWFSIPIRRASLVIANSEHGKREILSHRPETKNVTVIYPTISSAFEYSPKPFTTNRPRILQVGTTENKNLDRVLLSLQEITCILVIIGVLSSAMRNKLLNSGVHFENHFNLPITEIVRLYRQSDIVLFASTYEGFGMPIIEAQKTGRPVITSNVEPMQEVAGLGACYVDPWSVDSIHDGVIRVINDHDFRLNITAHGVENAKRFDPDKIAAQYQAAYYEVAGMGLT